MAIMRIFNEILIVIKSDVVEIGCGGGYYGIYFSDKCKSYLGINITSLNSVQARRVLESVIMLY